MKLLSYVMLLFLASNVLAQEDYNEIDLDSLAYYNERITFVTDSINATFTYEYGRIDLADGKASLQVPSGFKYLDPEQSAYVLTDLWGNPPSETLGLLLLTKGKIPLNNAIKTYGFLHVHEPSFRNGQRSFLHD